MIENEQKTEFIEHCIHYQKSQKESQKSSILSETFHMDAFNADIHFGTQFPTYWEGMCHGTVYATFMGQLQVKIIKWHQYLSKLPPPIGKILSIRMLQNHHLHSVEIPRKNL